LNFFTFLTLITFGCSGGEIFITHLLLVELIHATSDLTHINPFTYLHTYKVDIDFY